MRGSAHYCSGFRHRVGRLSKREPGKNKKNRSAEGGGGGGRGVGLT